MNNRRFKSADLQEWSNDEDRVKKSLRPETEIYVTCTAFETTWHCAVLKQADKRKSLPLPTRKGEESDAANH
ncbi:MAG TPA: hypothetical protein PLD20_13045 [Blastocatellia bacterium]|nr:hypothetical protein [Blastocatellia bacterium]HMX25564.1 hypothetical protein [Blastocatellia bacterium]HMZ18855.1 hypothetical protein [Blastocatellia bacterium]HNG31821.1 hypothetical protein [Blastocatellia bacterium]